MSFDSAEKSPSSGLPWEIYLFQTVGLVFRLTSADEPVTHLGQTYTPTTLRRDQMEETAEIDAGEVKVYIPKDHPLSQLFIPGLPPASIALTIFAGHYEDAEVLAIFAGSVFSSAYTDECELVCRSDKYLLQRKIPAELYQGLCNHVFGDPGCGINLSLFTYPGVVNAIDATGTVLTIDAFASLGSSLKAGYIKFAGGVRAIVAHSGVTVTLLSPIAVAVDDACTAVAGCAHTYPACKGYNNVANFLGFDLIPSINPFDQTTSLN
jgi:uncharacterized phage protein (TIGR02218 family)